MKRFPLPRALVFVLASLVAAVAASATSPSASWRPSAVYGADVRAFAIHPDLPDTVLAGTSGGQIYLSRDGGESWVDAAAPQPFLGWVVSALRFDPNEPRRVWAAMWGVWGGGMVAFSDDLGASWSYRHEKLPPSQVYSLALAPGKPGRLFIGTRQGVWASEDGGLTWQPRTRAVTDMQKVTSLLVDAASPDTVYAGSWQRAYRSDDGGRSWRGIFEGMIEDSEVFTLTPVPGRAGEMWASTCGWVYRSVDDGKSWARKQKGLETRRVPSFAALADGRLLAGTVHGVYLSSDSGESWAIASPSSLAVLAIGYHPARPNRILLGTEGSGVWTSHDGGATFHRAERAMTNLRVADLAVVGREVLAAVNHAGPASGIYSSIDRGKSFQLQRADLPTVLELAVYEGQVFAATERGLWTRNADYEWRRVEELGEARIERMEATGGSLHVHGVGLSWQHANGHFTVLREKSTQSTSKASGTEKLHPTGDARYPLAAVEGKTLRLLDAERKPKLTLELPVPGHEITTARIVGERLLLATAAYGVQIHDLGE